MELVTEMRTAVINRAGEGSTNRFRGGLALLALIASGMDGRPLAAQESREPQAFSTTWQVGEKARIGVYLQERCKRQEETVREYCASTPLVASVVVGGPAERAGIVAEDTLLAIDGMSLASWEGRENLLNLTEGLPVRLDVGRGSGRVTISVVPEVRLPANYLTLRAPWAGPDEAIPEVRVLRVPDVRADIDALEVRLESLEEGGNAFVFFRGDSAGELEVEVGTPEMAQRYLEELLGRAGDAERRMRDMGRPFAQAGESPAARPDERVRLGPPRYVWEDVELARRLKKIRDASLESARERFDSLVRLHVAVSVAMKDTSTGARSVTLGRRIARQGGRGVAVSRSSLPGELQALFLSDRRVAGAEFRELTPELAEYFQGTEAGLLVLRVLPGTPAARLGLRDGDVVVQAGGQVCRNIETLRTIIESRDGSGSVTVRWVRKGALHSGVLTDD
jgi:hypothetical protein